MSTEDARRRFPAELDQVIELEPPGCRWHVGANVLRGLVEGIGEFVEARQPRWRCRRDCVPVMLAAAPWFNDPELVEAMQQLAGAVIVIGKSALDRRPDPAVLAGLTARLPGLPLAAFPNLAEFAPRIGGEPQLVGPYDRRETVLESVRLLGFRSRERGDWPPLTHHKVALLGHLCWGEADPIGEVAYFRPKRLWRGSVNFTRGSRASLAEGGWMEEPQLLELFERYLLQLVAFSEPLDATAIELEPELAPVVYDDDAFAELLAEQPWEPENDEEP